MSTNAEMPQQDNTSYESIRMGDFEYTVKGTQDYTERRMNEVIQHITRSETTLVLQEPVQRELPFPGETTPSLVQNGDVAHTTDVVTNSGNKNHAPTHDICQFYSKKDPKNQYEVMLVTTYYLTNVEGLDHIGYAEYEEGIKRLLSEGVKRSSNPRQLVKKGVEEGVLYKPEFADGKFALTRKGREFVEKMGSE